MARLVFSICSANYLAYARTLFQSVAAHCSDAKFVLFLVDEIDGRFDPEGLGFEVIEARALDCPSFHDMAARYTIMEMNTAVKPFCFRHVFERLGAHEAIYLDPDILAISDFTELWALLAEDSTSIVLTPHGVAPLGDGKNPDDVQMLRAGAYNLGFCAMKKSAPAEAFIAWWSEHLVGNCVVDVSNGVFVDQKFCDLAPSYFDGVRILRHEGYNVAYWNLLNRPVTLDEAGETWRAGAAPLRFFHFSGVAPGDDTVFSKHQDRFTVEDIGDAKFLLERYLDALEENSRLDGAELRTLDYAYGRLEGGMAYTDDMRRVWRETHPPAPRDRAQAFGGDLGRFLTFSPEIKQDAQTPITRLMFEIWQGRADLRRAFHLQSEQGRCDFSAWFASSGVKEHNVPAALGAATAALAREPAIARPAPGFMDRQADSDAGSDAGPVQFFSPWAAPKSIALDLSPGLSMFGYFRAETGLGSAVRANYLAARRAGVAVSAHDIAGKKPIVAADIPLAFGPASHDCALFHLNADETLQLESFVDPRALQGVHRIGYWVWELQAFPLEWAEAFDKVDEIWCPSTFAARAFRQRTDKPVVVIPHPVVAPKARDAAADRRSFDLPADALIFLAAFDADSFVDRKNPMAAIDAFERAFPHPKSQAILVLKVRRGKWRADASLAEVLKRAAADPRIRVIDAVLPQGRVAALQSAADVFVSLHRSEGFGLWIAECMALGKPVVVTDYSGNCDFTNAANSMPISAKMRPIRQGQYPFGEGRVWAEPDIEAAAEAMRALGEDGGLRERLGAAASRSIETALSYENVGAKIAARLNGARAELFDLPQLIAA